MIGYVNASGQFVIRPQFTDALPFDGDRAAVEIGGNATTVILGEMLGAHQDGERVGFIDRSGRYAISPRFYCITRFRTGQYAVVAKELSEPKPPKECVSKANAKEELCRTWANRAKVTKECSGWTIIDRSGKEILPQTYEDLDYYEGNLVAAATLGSHDMERWGYIDLSGKWVVAPEYDTASAMWHDRGIVVKGDNISIIDATGKIVKSGVRSLGAAFGSHFSEGVATATESTERGRPTQGGYIDLAGAFVIQPQFDDTEEFREGLAPVEIAGLWGFISHDGQLAINPSFKQVSHFQQGRAAVCTNEGKLGFIDRSGQLLKGTPRPCPHFSPNWAKWFFDSAFRDGTFTHDYDTDALDQLTPDNALDYSASSSPGWTIIDTRGRVIYQERHAAISSVAGTSANRHGERRVMTGTAFVVSDSGYLLSNAHVVDGCSRVELPSAKTFAEVVKSDLSNDLALLHASSLGNRYARIARPEDVSLGTGVVIFGFPLTGVVASSGNLTTGVVSAVTGLGDDSRFFQLTAPIQPGNSGGPVLNDYGEVIGIASATLDQRKAIAAIGNLTQNVNFAIGPSMIRQFLSANGVAAVSPNSWWRFKQGTQKLAASAESFTYSVKCESQDQGRTEAEHTGN